MATVVDPVQDVRVSIATDDLMEAVREIQEHYDDYEIAEQYYKGDVPEIICNPKLRRIMEQYGEAYKFNLAKTPVNAVADRLTIQSLQVRGENETANNVLREIWDGNRMKRQSAEVNLKSCEFGDFYLFAWAGEEEGSVQVTQNYPQTTRIFYDEETGLPKFGAKIWKSKNSFGQTYWRSTLYYKDHFEKYVTVAGMDPTAPTSWKFFYDSYDEDENGVWPENPYGRLPLFHFRTGTPYGTPVHKDAYGPQNAVTKQIVTQMSTTDFMGFPQRYFLMDPQIAGSEEDDTMSEWDDDDSESQKTSGEESKLTGGPGRVWMLKGLKAAGEFSTANPENFLKPAEFYVRMMAQTTTTPLHYFDPSGDAPSGESLKTADAPLVKKTEDMQDSLGSSWEEWAEFCLLVAGVEDVRVDVRWKPAESTQSKDGWDVIQAKIEAGVPPRQAFLEAGYTSEEVTSWGIPTFEENNETQNLVRRVGILNTIGEAVQKLAAGVGTGILSEETTAALVTRVLGETNTETEL